MSTLSLGKVGDYRQAIQKEFESFKNSKDILAKDIRDLMLDSGVEKSPAAETYLLKSVGVPVSYYNRSNDQHKREIMDNVLKTYPDMQARVLLQENKLVAAGPVVELPFADMSAWIQKKMGDVNNLTGSIVDNSFFRVFSSQMEESVGKDVYCLGVDMDISALFCNGVKFRPMLFQVICANGLVKTVGNPSESLIKPMGVSVESLEYGLAATQAILEHKEQYFSILRKANERPAFTSAGLKLELEEARFPKSFIEKTVNLTGRIEAKEAHITEPVPASITSLRDNLSVMTDRKSVV